MAANNQERENKYSRLYNIFYNKIISGEWKDGQKILPERELCQLCSVSRITVRETLHLLEQEGLISRRQGRGTFVHRKPVEQKLTKLYRLREQFQRLGIENIAKICSFAFIPADMFLSRALGVEINSSVVKIERIFYAAGTPYVLETNYLPANHFPGITKEMVQEHGLYNTFSDLGVLIQRAVDQMKPILVDKVTASLLKVKVNDAAMLIDRTTYSQNTIIEFTRSIVRGDYCVYTVELSSAHG